MRDQQGFSLLETMLAVTVLFIGIAVVMSTLSASMQANSVTEEQNAAINLLSSEAARLNSMTLMDLEAEFGTAFDQVKSFPVEELRDAFDNPAVMTVSAVIPDPPNNSAALVQFTIKVEYSTVVGDHSSGAAFNASDETTIWVSPNY